MDGDAAKTVRMIFDLAVEGKRTKSIALHLNELGIQTPGIYNRERKLWGTREMVAPEKEQLWDSGKL